MWSNCMASAHFEVNQTKIKGGRQLGRKVVPQDSKSDLPLAERSLLGIYINFLLLKK